jgi:hypothetical protein
MVEQVRRARLVAALVLIALLLAACETGKAEPDKRGAEPSAGSSGTASATPSSAPSPTPTVAAAADPEHAVEPPPPLAEPLLPADMLVYGREPISKKMLAEIRKIRNIVAVEQLSMAQVSIENRVVVVAAVDPASYRRFTPLTTAQNEEVWTRVAGGELAIPPRLGQELQTPDAFIKLGNDKTAPQVHIGAYAEGVRRIDAVVNKKWGQELGMIEGNALLLSTGINSPQSVRTALQRIVGSTASVQILTPDLDISVQQTAFLTGGSVAEAVGSFNYRVLGGGRIAPDPAWVSRNIRTATVPILGRITCHKVMLPQLEAALREVRERGLADKVYQTAGCYYPRFIANTTALSLHSFGIAIDINSLQNGRGSVGQMDRTVVEIFKKWGFAWGGDWGYTDPMHFEVNRIVVPR